MNERCRFIKSVALALVGVQLFIPAAHAFQGASLSGHVLASPSSAPLPGAKVFLANAKSGEVLASAQSGTDGSFALRDLAPGTYHVAVESKGGLYTVDTPLTLGASDQKSVHLAINPSPRTAAAAEPAASASPMEEEKKKKSGSLGPWDNPLTASLVVVGSAVLLGVLIDQIDDNGTSTTGTVSPSSR